ncbi:MAG: HEAT repeat domain-containing protein [Candidatus Hodarchaeales archaeon]|jgi:HEAT repeat protein
MAATTLEQLIAAQSQFVTVLSAFLRATERSLSENWLLNRFGRRLDDLRVTLRVLPYEPVRDAEALRRSEHFRRNGPTGRDREHDAKRIYRFRGNPAEEQEDKSQGVVPELLNPLADRLRLGVVLGDPGSGKTEWLKQYAREAIRKAIEQLADRRTDPEEIVFPIFMRLPHIQKGLQDGTKLVDLLLETGCYSTRPATLDDTHRIVAAILQAMLAHPPVEQKGASGHKAVYLPDRTTGPLSRAALKRIIVPWLWRRLTNAGEPAQSGSILLCLDAWDEVRYDQPTLARHLHTLAAQGNVRIFLTSRIMGYLDKPLPIRDDVTSTERELQICPFSWTETQTFVQGFFHDNDRLSASMLAELRAKVPVACMAQNPLMVTLLCMAFAPNRLRSPLRFPARRVEIYERVLKGLLGEWTPRRESTRPRKIGRQGKLLIQAKLRLLKALAYHVFPDEELNQDRLHDFLLAPHTGYLHTLATQDPLRQFSDADDLVEALCEDGVLVPGSSDSFLFLHLTFQEYLAARRLAALPECTEIALQHLYQPAWHEVLVLLGGCFEDTDRTRAYIRQLMKKMPEDLLLRPLLLAGEASSETRHEISTLYKEQLVQELFHILFFYKELIPWPRLLYVLGLFREWSLPGLVAILQDDQQALNLREDVAKSLAQMGAKEAVSHMLAILWHCKNDFLRASIAASLAQMGAKETVSDMLAFLRDVQQEFFLRAMVATSLGQMGSKEAASDMLAILQDGQEDFHVREKVAESLGQMRAKEVVPNMLAFLRDDQPDDYRRDYLRGKVVESLEQMGAKEAVSDLLIFLRDNQPDNFGRDYVRGKIAESLGRMGAKEAVSDLLAILRDDQQDDSLRCSTARGLTQMRIKEAVSDLLAILRDDKQDRSLRVQAAASLGRMGVKEAVPDLLAMLQDDQLGNIMRERIANSLAQMEGRGVVPCFLAILRDDQQENHLRGNTAVSLGQMGAKEAVSDMLAILRDDQQGCDLHMSVAVSLGQMGVREAVSDMLAILRDDKQDRERRWRIADILGQMGAIEAVSDMLVILRDDQQDSTLRSSVVNSLARIGAKEAVSGTLAILRDGQQDDFLRVAAAEYLVQMQVKEAVPDMLTFLKDVQRDRYWRERITRSLAQIGARVDSIMAYKGQGLDAFARFLFKSSQQLIALLEDNEPE